METIFSKKLQHNALGHGLVWKITIQHSISATSPTNHFCWSLLQRSQRIHGSIHNGYYGGHPKLLRVASNPSKHLGNRFHIRHNHGNNIR